MKNKKFYPLVAGVLAVVLLIGSVGYGQVLAEGIKKGLNLCATVLVPSLFPFMVIANFLVLSGIYKTFSLPLLPITKYLFKMPKHMGPIVLLSFIGGFPVGAKNVESLYKRGDIDKTTAESLLSFCINPGPAFIVTSVGAGMLTNFQTGLILFASQIFASVVVGIVFSKRANKVDFVLESKPSLPIAESFVKSVNDNVSAMLAICGFVVIFSAIIEVLKAIELGSPLVQGALFSLLEVTTGCANAASNFVGKEATFFVVLALSVCGISVICQVKAILSGSGLSLHKFYLSRLLHFPVMYFTTLFLFHLFPNSAPVFSNSATIVTGVSNNSAGGFIFLVLACFSLIHTLSDRVKAMRK